MAARYKKLGVKDIRYSGKYILASVIVEALLLAPKTTITWQGKEVQVGGVLPMLQKEIAGVLRNGVNTFLPKAATTVENMLRQTPIKDIAIEKILWFVYDYMSDVTLNSLATTVLDRAGLSDTIKLEGFTGTFKRGTEASITPVEAQYLRVSVTKAGIDGRVRIGDIEVYGKR